MICDVCGEDKDDVVAVNDPYLEEMYEVVEPISICRDCFADKQGDI